MRCDAAQLHVIHTHSSSTPQSSSLWRRLRGRPVSESGRLCRGDGAHGPTAPPERASVGYPLSSESWESTIISF